MREMILKTIRIYQKYGWNTYIPGQGLNYVYYVYNSLQGALNHQINEYGSLVDARDLMSLCKLKEKEPEFYQELNSYVNNMPATH